MPPPASANDSPELEFTTRAAASDDASAASLDTSESTQEMEEMVGGEDDISLTDLRDEISAANAESRRNARRTADVLKQFGTVLDAMSGTLQDLHRTARSAALSPASSETSSSGVQRDQALSLIDLSDRVTRIASAFSRPPAATTSWLPGARRALEAWQEAWTTQENAFAILRLHLDEMLRQAGLERLAVIGKPFDPVTMTAVEAVTDTAAADHSVLAELLPGWRHAGTGAMLRPAQVRVSRR